MDQHGVSPRITRGDRIASWVGRSTVGSGPGPAGEGVHEQTVDPGNCRAHEPMDQHGVSPRITRSHQSDSEQLQGLQQEEKVLLDKVKKYNNNIQEQDITEVDEVVIYGDVQLNEEEQSLLNLGPGFMVTAPLDSEEMQVEAVVTLTKLRWGRRGRGTEDMTDTEIALEEREKGLDKLEEEESIVAGIQSVARDVISEDEKSVRMGRMRVTDMKNNREVCMSGPAPPSVEAALNTRMGVWQECYDRYKKRNCNKKGAQIKSNLTLGQ